ncbi:MAG: HNH endonuclease [Propionibacteriales bacterium]|nr:HNH endonuclease [Propionibacteriales bacterium]
MFDKDIDGLGADATLQHAADVLAIRDLADGRLLEVAAHYADLHGHVTTPTDPGGVSLPSMERLVPLGGAGTPEVAEFAPAELGAELAMSPCAAARLIGDALDLRHRLPRLWSRVLAGEVKSWIARNVAQATRDLSVETVSTVDAKVSPWSHSLSWGRLEAIISAAAIAADPEAAAREVERAAQARGVWVKPSSDHGIKDIFIRTDSPNAIWFDATVDRIADGLGLLGDSSTKDVRRAHAVGIIAHPQRAIDLFERAAALAGPDDVPDPEYQARDEGADSNDECQVAPSSGDGGGEPLGQGEPTTNTTPRGRQIDSRPHATLYVHIGADTFTRDATGVARFEGVGPITVDQAKAFLGHCRVTVKPVIDLASKAPVDAYEVPDRLREATHLRSPVDVFPYATNQTRRRDIDHTDRYIDADDGGPPGQTRLDNLGPLTRFHHRIKTHGRWQVAQPFNGVFVWQSPRGRLYLVDHTGTHKISNPAA